MLEFLQTGKMLYVLAVMCAVGTFSKLVTGSLYKRLIKETGNMALTKDKNLKALKQRMENVFLINHGIRNVTAYIEKQMYGFRFLHISLDAWNSVSMQMMILSFMAGGAAAFGAYWYRCDPYYIALYGTAGIFGGLFLAFVDNGVGAGTKRKQLADHLVDYVENSPHFYKTADAAPYPAQGRLRQMPTPAGFAGFSGNPGVGKPAGDAETEKTNGRFSVLGKKKDGTSSSGETVIQENSGLVRNKGAGKISRIDKRNVRNPESRDVAARENYSVDAGKMDSERMGPGKIDPGIMDLGGMDAGETGNPGLQNSRNPAVEPGMPDSGPVSETELARSINHLSESLKQIAASREMQGDPPQCRDRTELIRSSMTPEELRMLKTLFGRIPEDAARG